MFPNRFPDVVTNPLAGAFPGRGLKSVETITEEFLTIQQKAFRGEALTVSDISKLNQLLTYIMCSSLPASDKQQIINTTRAGFKLCTDPSEESAQNAKLEEISMLLLKNCSDEAISYFLGLDTWQSEGNIQEAKARILHFVCHADGNPQKLDLSNLGLSLLPEKMFPCLISLNEFSCDGNHLTSLPASIWNVPDLQILNVSNNKLTSLPAEVNCLGLRKLNLNNNCLSSLPAEIVRLQSLTNLDCSGNRFTELPQALAAFNDRVRLNFCSNQIFSCPPEFAHLTLNISGQNPVAQADEGHTPAVKACKDRGQEIEAYEARLAANETKHKAWMDEQERLHREETARLTAEMEMLAARLSQMRAAVSNRTPPQPVPGILKLKQAVSDTRPDLKNLNLSNLQADRQAWATISLFIDKIIGTDDFKNFPAMTAQRLLLILQLAEANEEYRTAVNAALMEALSSCVDRASFFFCSLETQKAILEVGNGSLEEMFKVLKGAYAIELFDIWASDFVKRHPSPRVKKEALSVHLALKVEFKKEFCLPIGIEEMNYRFCAHLEPLDYQNARSEVIVKLQNQGPFLEFLLGQEPWLEKLRKDFSSERDAVLQDVNQALEELEQQRNGYTKTRRDDGCEQHVWIQITDQEYLEGATALMKKFKAVESAWLKAKTQAILAAG